MGNIYADEALWRAELHPLSPAGSMRREHVEALREGVIEALEAGLEGGGASIDDYLDSRGRRGAMQDEFCVHTREGEPCLRCGTPIRRIVVGGRSTYFCPELPGAAAAATAAPAPEAVGGYFLSFSLKVFWTPLALFRTLALTFSLPFLLSAFFALAFNFTLIVAV